MSKSKLAPVKSDDGFAPGNTEQVNGWKDRLKDGLKRRRISQRKLAVEAGLGATSMRYIISDAETITLSTALGIANALNVPIKELLTGEKLIIEVGGDMEERIAVVGIADRGDDIKAPADGKNGVAAIAIKGKLKNIRAFLQDDSSMEAHGANEMVPVDMTVAQGDIVIWSPDLKPRPGTLAVVRERHGPSGSWVSVRKIVIDDNGDYRAIANDADYGRPVIKREDVLGGVLVVQRVLTR